MFRFACCCSFQVCSIPRKVWTRLDFNSFFFFFFNSRLILIVALCLGLLLETCVQSSSEFDPTPFTIAQHIGISGFSLRMNITHSVLFVEVYFYLGKSVEIQPYVVLQVLWMCIDICMWACSQYQALPSGLDWSAPNVCSPWVVIAQLKSLIHWVLSARTVIT